MVDLITDIKGQVERLPLAATAFSAMLPMFEAISNAIHAIDDKFGNDDAEERGNITIEIVRDKEGGAESVVVTDDGIGLNSENFQSFSTPHSVYKKARGGKGLGRLSWLRIMKSTRVESYFEKPDRQRDNRVFNFVLRNENQIDELDELPSFEPLSTGTRVHFQGFDRKYEGKFPRDVQGLALLIIRHFMPLFVGDRAPKVTLFDGENIDLRKHFQARIKKQDEDILEVDLLGRKERVTIKHMRCVSSVVTKGSNGKNTLCYCANGRGVQEIGIDKQIGQGILGGGETIYIGVVTSDFLDNHINAERTAFTFSNVEMDKIRTSLTEFIAEFLVEDFKVLYKKKKKNLEALLNKKPSLRAVVDEDIDTFVVKGISLAAVGEEELFRELDLKLYRKQNRQNIAAKKSFRIQTLVKCAE